MNDLIGLFVVAGIIGFCFILIMYQSKIWLKKLERSWRYFAEENGLNLIESKGLFSSFPKITGNYKGYNYTMDILKEDSETVYTYIILNFSFRTNCHLHICRKGLRSRHGEALRPYKSGNTDFDESFILRTCTPEHIEKILTEDICSILLIKKDIMNISIFNNKIYYENNNIMKDISELNYINDILYQISEKLNQKALTDIQITGK
jgi:hypothetical protein